MHQMQHTVSPAGKKKVQPLQPASMEVTKITFGGSTTPNHWFIVTGLVSESDSSCIYFAKNDSKVEGGRERKLIKLDI